MDNKFELVEKYNIDVDVFIDEDGVTPVGKLPDNHLTKEFLRLYFTGQITKVWKRWLSDIYYAMTTKGEEISLPKLILQLGKLRRLSMISVVEKGRCRLQAEDRLCNDNFKDSFYPEREFQMLYRYVHSVLQR